MADPYSTPNSDLVSSVTLKPRYRGMRRLPYCALMGALLVGHFMYVDVRLSAVDGEVNLPTVGISFLLLTMFPSFQRLRNTGVPWWWGFLLLVPVANMVVWLAGVALPEGFRDKRRLDTPGKILLGAIIALTLLALVAGGFFFQQGRS